MSERLSEDGEVLPFQSGDPVGETSCTPMEKGSSFAHAFGSKSSGSASASLEDVGEALFDGSGKSKRSEEIIRGSRVSGMWDWDSSKSGGSSGGDGMEEPLFELPERRFQRELEIGGILVVGCMRLVLDTGG